METITGESRFLRISRCSIFQVLIAIILSACGGKLHVDYEDVRNGFDSFHEVNNLLVTIDGRSRNYSYFQYYVPSPHTATVYFSAIDPPRYDRAVQGGLPVRFESITLWAVDRPICARKTKVAYIMKLFTNAQADWMSQPLLSDTRDNTGYQRYRGRIDQARYGDRASAEVETLRSIPLLVTNSATISTRLGSDEEKNFTAFCATGYAVKLEQDKEYSIRVNNWSTPDSGYRGFGCEFSVYELDKFGDEAKKIDMKSLSREALAELSTGTCSDTTAHGTTPITFIGGRAQSNLNDPTYKYNTAIIKDSQRRLREQCAAQPERC